MWPRIPSRSPSRQRSRTQATVIRGVVAKLVTIATVLLMPTLAKAGNVAPGATTFDAPFSGSFPWLVIRCHTNDEPAEPQSTGYFERLFTIAGKGTMNVVDYWHDVSFGQINVEGTIVAKGKSADANGWYTIPIKQAQFDSLSRNGQVKACAYEASTDYFFGDFYGLITIFPSTDTAALPGGDADNHGPTGISFLGALGGPSYILALSNFPSNVNLTFAAHEMGHGFGLLHSRLLSTSNAAYGDLYDIMSAMNTGSFTPPASDNKDVAYGGSNNGSAVAAKGPGPDASTLDNEGWIPLNRIAQALPGFQGSFHLHSLSDADALADNPTAAAAGGAGELLEERIAAAVTFPFSPAGQNCTSSYYTLEYREPVRWDAGIATPASFWNPKSAVQLNEINLPFFPIGSVVMHLVCLSSWERSPPSYSYSLLVDSEPNGGGHKVSHNANFYSKGTPPLGAYYPGDEYADDANGFYFAVNAMDTFRHEALVTVARQAGPIKDKLTMKGPTTATIGERFAASALLMTDAPAPGNNAMVPGHVVTFKLGSSKCVAVSDLDGTASCHLTVAGHPATKATLTATADATRAYLEATATSTISLQAATKKPKGAAPRTPEPNVTINRPAPPPKPSGGGV
jgi:hypothetical protein